jgi:hypothetical protein
MSELTTRTEQLNQDLVRVVVERDGALRGYCHLFTAVHWDGWWLAPDARGQGAVLKALVVASLTLLKEAGLDMVYTGVEDDRVEIRQLLEKFGFQPAPGKLFLLKVDDAALQLQRQRSNADGRDGTDDQHGEQPPGR